MANIYIYIFRWSALWNTENKCVLFNKAITFIHLCVHNIQNNIFRIYNDIFRFRTMYFIVLRFFLLDYLYIFTGILSNMKLIHIITHYLQVWELKYHHFDWWSQVQHFTLFLLLCLFVCVCLCLCICPHHVLFNHRTVDRSERTYRSNLKKSVNVVIVRSVAPNTAAEI